MKQLRQGDLFRAIGNIDDSYIEEAIQPAPQRKIRPIRWAVLAACLSLAVGISVLAPLLLMDGSFSVLSSGSSSAPSGRPRPFRTASMILKERFSGIPQEIR